ncbi:hypothetical protein BSKO_01497 [Bryopsis sp. KO-2023]|nr:hypothetical protein BSKO_01497 [Bryopsis sp. KO-2023]
MKDSFGPFAAGVVVGCAASAAIYCLHRGKKTGVVPVECANPHPEWKPGQKQNRPFDDSEMLALDPADLGASATYPLVISAVVPRPIAFTSSVNSEGVGNLAPFSYFNVVSHDPPCVAVSVCTSGVRGGGLKDTAHNILETGEFVVNIMSEWFVEAANHTCGNFDPGVNEMELSGLTPVPSVKVAPPRVKESAFHMECKLVHSHKINNSQGKHHATVFIGEVVLFHVHKDVAGKSPSGKTILDLSKYLPMSRLGGNYYGRTTSYFDLPRPDRGWQNVTRE